MNQSPPNRGAHIILVGPDGVGKTTLRHALEGALKNQVDVISDRGTGPLVNKRSGSELATRMIGEKAVNMLVGELKVLYLFIDRILRALMITWPRQRHGTWLITERGWWDIAVFPRRYRLRNRPLLHKWLSPLAPRPDLIIVLEGEPDVILARKRERTAEELEAQTRAWRSVIPSFQPHSFLNTDASPAEVVERAGALIQKEIGWFPSLASES